MKKEKMTALMNDKTAMAELAKCKTVEELAEKLNACGAECTVEEAAKFVAACKKLADKSEKMDVNDMDAVAGGLSASLMLEDFLAPTHDDSDQYTFVDPEWLKTLGDIPVSAVEKSAIGFGTVLESAIVKGKE